MTSFTVAAELEDAAAAPAPPVSDTQSERAGWQQVLQVAGACASPGGSREAVTALAWCVRGIVGLGKGAPGEALLVFARADGLAGAVDLVPGGDAPAVLWSADMEKGHLSASPPLASLALTV